MPDDSPPAAPLLIARDGAVLRLTLNRPGAGNAIDMALARALATAAEDAAADPAIRCVLLTGAGRLFCAGGDIGGMVAAEADADDFLAQLAGTLHRAVLTLATMPKPLLVAVNGPAAGAGFSLALLGDIVICGASAHFTAAYAGIGLTPDGGMSWLLPRLVGLRRAQAMILTNERIDAARAGALDMVTQVVDDTALTETADAMAHTLVAAPTAALGAARRLLVDGATTTLAAHLDAEAAAIARAGGGAEAREGLAAFLARRRPAFPVA